jgi:hypothetical protein
VILGPYQEASFGKSVLFFVILLHCLALMLDGWDRQNKQLDVSGGTLCCWTAGITETNNRTSHRKKPDVDGLSHRVVASA